MSLWSWFSGTEDSDQQAADVQAHHDALQASIDRHRDQGDLTNDQLDFASRFDTNAGPAQDGSFLNSFSTRNEGVEPTPGVGSVLKDLLIGGAVGGVIWLFIKLGGGSLTQRIFKSRSMWGIAGIVAGAGLLLYLVYKYSRQAVSD